MRKPFKKWDKERRLIVINSIISIIVLLFGIGFIYFMDDFFVPQYGPRDPLNDSSLTNREQDQATEDRVSGCTDPEACNYDPVAEEDDGSCDYYITEVNGDFNGDGLVNILDVVTGVGIVLEGVDISFDMNGDGLLNVLDIVLLVNCALNDGGNCITITNLPPDLGEFVPTNTSGSIELDAYLTWLSENGHKFDVYLSDQDTNLNSEHIVSSDQSEDLYYPDLVSSDLYAWKVVAKSENCQEGDSCCINDSGVLTFSTVLDDEDDQGEGEVEVEVIGMAEWHWAVQDGQTYNSYDFGQIERGQILVSSEIGNGRGIEIINNGTVPLNMRLNYTDFLFDSLDSNWQYFSKCVAINHETGEMEEYASGDDGCAGESIQLDNLDILDSDQPIVTCLKYTTQENPYKPAISIGQSIFISYEEPLGEKAGLIDIKMWATDEELNCTDSPFDEETTP